MKTPQDPIVRDLNGLVSFIFFVVKRAVQKIWRAMVLLFDILTDILMVSFYSVAHVYDSLIHKRTEIPKELHTSRAQLTQKVDGLTATPRQVLGDVTSKVQSKLDMKKPKKGKFSIWGLIKKLLLYCVILGFLLVGAFFIWAATLAIPEVGNFTDREVIESTKIYDNTGEIILYDVFSEEKRTVIKLDLVSQNMRDAILATEDDKFYSHNGVRPEALVRSIVNKIKEPSSRLASGSTITQQVIKNSLLTNERSLDRKVKEWVLAWRVEQELTKDEILEAYLNEIPFGGSIYGVEQAALSFFEKNASELTVAESAYLAGIPKAPTFYSPYGQNRARLEGRKDYILGRMLELGYITKAEFEDAKAEEVVFRSRVDDTGIKAPHFVFYVIEYLEEVYGVEEVERGGLRVITTLDWELQQKMEEETALYAERLPAFRATNLASVAVEPSTGKIVGMVGSRGYFDDEIDGKYNIATAQRQPGSTFKPFVYAKAFEVGYTPQTVLWDVDTEFSTACFPDGTPKGGDSSVCYSPKNYDGSTRGPVQMGAALAQSLNIPAVKALYLTGISQSIDMAHRLGISGLTQSPNFYGLNLVLGGGEVKLLDMVSAYGVFGNDGLKNKPIAVLQIQDREGTVLESYEKNEERVLDSNVARMISAILSNDDLKRPVFGESQSLYHSGVQVAVKTGTTNSYRDTWTIGYTPNVAVGVWIGNNDNTVMAQEPSSTVAAPYWRKVMDAARSRYPQVNFIEPAYLDPATLQPALRGVYQGYESVMIDTRTGYAAEEGTPDEYLKEEYVIDYRSILHWVNKLNPMQEGDSRSDTLYEYFEYNIPAWVASSGLPQPQTQQFYPDAPVSEPTRISEPKTVPIGFTITSPQSMQTIAADKRMKVELSITGPKNDIDRIYYYLNGTYLGSGGKSESSMSFTPSSVRNIEAINTLKVILQTDDGRRIQREVEFKVQ